MKIKMGTLSLIGLLLFPSLLFAFTLKGQYFRYHKVRGNSVAQFERSHLDQAPEGSAYHHAYYPAMHQGIPDIPAPHKIPQTPKTLSLHEAIALALRSNPDIQVAELQRIVDKFGLEVSIWQQYEPQFQPLNVTSTLKNGVNPDWNLTTGLKFYSPTGTTVNLGYQNNLLGGIGATNISITQHLLQGGSFAVNTVGYDNAIDQEWIARLGFKNSIINVVFDVIQKYRSLVESYNNLKTNANSLQSQLKQVEDSKLQVKAGKMAESDLLQQQENLETTRLLVKRQEQSLRDSYQDFLSTLGLVSSTKIVVERHISVDGVTVPSRKKATKIALAHNIEYQTALINLRIAKRQLLVDEDARRWTLDMTGNVTLARQANIANGPTIGQDQGPTLGFTLNIPINDLSLKQAVVDDRVAIESAKIQLAQQKENLIRSVYTQLDDISNQREQINIAQLAVKLQKQTLKNAQLKFKYGKTTAFEVNSLTNQLVEQEVNLTSTKIDYLNGVSQLYQLLGITLEKWMIKLRY